MNNVEKMFSECSESFSKYAQAYAAYLTTLLAGLDYRSLNPLVKAILAAREEGKKIVFIGNGGSAATASHFANDIGVGTRASKKPFRALSLTDNNASMTAIANDDGYNAIFRRQLEIFFEPGDILVAISASGNSPNLIEALEYARERGNKTFGLVGFDGGKMKSLCDHLTVVETPKGEYGPVEDIHMIFDHMIGSYLYYYIRQQQ